MPMAEGRPAETARLAEAGSLRIGVFRGQSGLDALADSWRGLAARLERPSYVHLWEWHRSYLEAEVFQPDRVIFCAAFEGDRTVAILPLVRADKRRFGMPIRLLGLPLDPLTPHADILVDPQVLPRFDLLEVLHALRHDLGESWDVVRLGMTLEDSIATAVVRRLHSRPGRFLVTSHPRGLSNALAIAPYDEMLARFSKKLRSSLSNCRNRLAKLDGVEVRWAHTADALEAAFPLLLAVEGSGWKGEAGTTIESDPRRHAMYRGFIKHLGPASRCHVILLTHGEHVMAGMLALAVGDRLYSFKIGYDEAYKREAPGKMLREQLLQKLAEDPQIRFLDLISNQRSHKEWRPVQRREFVHYICRTASLGALFWAAIQARQTMRSASGTREQNADGHRSVT